MATKAAYRRLTKEYIAIQKNPPSLITAKPLESNILEWHYVIEGPPDSPYHGGEYYGRLTFPSDYPYKPPAIRMVTPSGRFQTETRLCLSMSDFHPSQWNPSWSVATILTGLLSFMTTEEATTGSMKTTDDEKRLYAKRSHDYNSQHAKFKELFPERVHAKERSLPASLRRRQSPRTATTADALAAKLREGQQDQEHNQPTAGLLSRWRRWVLILVVFVYLILSKLASRSGGSESTS